MEPVDIVPEQLGRQLRPLGEIFGKLRVIGGRERQIVAKEPGASGDAERTFGRNVARVRIKRKLQEPNNAPRRKLQRDSWTTRQEKRPEGKGRDESRPVPPRVVKRTKE